MFCEVRKTIPVPQKKSKERVVKAELDKPSKPIRLQRKQYREHQSRNINTPFSIFGLGVKILLNKCMKLVLTANPMGQRSGNAITFIFKLT